MHSDRELIRLANYKAGLRRNIAVHRAECAGAIIRVAQPLVWLNRLLALWRQLGSIPPSAAVPVGLLVMRTIFRRRKFLCWALVIFGALHSRRAAVRSR